MKFTRLTVNPEGRGGGSYVCGLRILVATVVGIMAEGMTADKTLAICPDIEAANVHDALGYAAEEVVLQLFPEDLLWTSSDS